MSGGVAGLAAAAVGGPLALLTFALLDPQLNGEGDILPAILGVVAASVLSMIIALVIAGIPAAVVGAVLGNWIYEKPLNRGRVVVVLLVGNVLTIATLIGWILRVDDSSIAGVIGTFVVCTLASLVAVEVFKRLRRRIGGIA